MSSVFGMVTNGMVCPKCGSTNTHDNWSCPDDHGLWIDHNWRCRDCGWDDSKKKPMTNGDKIRAMSDDELATWWSKYADCDNCRIWKDCELSDTSNCREALLHWLKREAKSEEIG